MKTQDTIEKTIKQLLQSLPPNLHAVRKDIENHLKRTLQNAFAAANLITREEFDVQVAVLQRTRSKLESLEKQLADYEKNKP